MSRATKKERVVTFRSGNTITKVDHDAGIVTHRQAPRPPPPLNRSQTRRLTKLATKAARLMLENKWSEAEGFCIVNGLPFDDLKQRVEQHKAVTEFES